MSYEPTYTDRLRLAALFYEADEAGFGITDGDSFEAFPGLESAAVEFMAHRMTELARGA